MRTVKIRKEEIEAGELPSLCMICGEKDAETKVPFTAKVLFFPLNVLGILGKYLTPRKYDMSVYCCNDCKSGFIYEQSMGNIWLSLRFCTVLALCFVLFANLDGAPANLLIPMILVISTVILETLYFWTLGKKNAVRVLAIDNSSVSLELPNEQWSAALSKIQRDKETEKRRRF